MRATSLPSFPAATIPPSGRLRGRIAGLLPLLLAGQLLAVGIASAAIAPAASQPAAADLLPPALVADKHVVAGDLDIGYAELGPATGEVVVLLHGWPYDINAYAEVGQGISRDRPAPARLRQHAIPVGGHAAQW